MQTEYTALLRRKGAFSSSSFDFTPIAPSISLTDFINKQCEIDSFESTRNVPTGCRNAEFSIFTMVDSLGLRTNTIAWNAIPFYIWNIVTLRTQ